jgi:hypothetical protein
MGFRERWIEMLQKAATGTKKTRTLLTPIGVAIFGLFTALDRHQKDPDTSHAHRGGDLRPFHGSIRARRNLC